MLIGTSIPTMEMVDPGLIKDFSVGCEEIGINHLVAFDHVVGADPARHGGTRYPFIHTSTMIEPVALLSYVAGVTRKIGLVTGVVVLPQRQTVLFAKQAGNLDLLCGGRLRIGVGTGWNEIEYGSLGVGFSERGRKLDEQIGLLRQLWRESVVDFNGSFDQVDGAGMAPMPVQRPIPLWMGGATPKAIARAAHVGDGWFPIAVPAERADEAVSDFYRQVEANGRKSEDVGVEMMISTARGFGETERSFDDIVKEADAWRRAGATYFCLDTSLADFTGVDDRIDYLDRFKAALT